MFVPEPRRSLYIGTNTLAYFNDGFDVNVTYNTGFWRLGLSYSEMDYSPDDSLEGRRAGGGIYAGMFFLLAQTGLNIGLGFEYFYENTIHDIGSDGTVQQSLDGDLYRPYLRVAWAVDLVRFSRASIYLEPGLGFAYTFGDDLTFDSGREYDSSEFELVPSLSIGTKIKF